MEQRPAAGAETSCLAAYTSSCYRAAGFVAVIYMLQVDKQLGEHAE